VEHSHEAFMASLVEALEGERWAQADVSGQRQAEIDRLTSGKAVRPCPPTPAASGGASDIVGPPSGIAVNTDESQSGGAVRR
jgi:hypothetical protein